VTGSDYQVFLLSYKGIFHQNETPMNLKPNLWTLLFLLAAAALIYVQWVSSALVVQEERPPSTVALSDTIDRDTAWAMLDQYFLKFKDVLDNDSIHINGKTILDTTGVVAVPVYFKLEKNEIAEIFTHYGGQQVYAVLALLPGQRGARDTIDLLLSDVEPDPKNTFVQGTFYDFSTPCPPLCE
jgi:hypothetical protein